MINMNETPSIEFKSVDLFYSSLAFRNSSLKEYFLHILMKKERFHTKDIHALKDISFTITSGERVALLGQNGAGKSTLLKAAAGLYPINSGIIRRTGEVRALFEIGLGFEPEATGRENIMYRGLLLGQTPDHMLSMEHNIIEFADIDEFIDYPIKTYSVGMLVRLAFAISTTIPGDILLLDEVIGAGDAGFMVKAQKRIEDLIEKSKILILASHDFSSVKRLCNRTIVLHHGEIVYDGDTEGGITKAMDLQGLK